MLGHGLCVEGATTAEANILYSKYKQQVSDNSHHDCKIKYKIRHM